MLPVDPDSISIILIYKILKEHYNTADMSIGFIQNMVAFIIKSSKCDPSPFNN